MKELGTKPKFSKKKGGQQIVRSVPLAVALKERVPSVSHSSVLIPLLKVRCKPATAVDLYPAFGVPVRHKKLHEAPEGTFRAHRMLVITFNVKTNLFQFFRPPLQLFLLSNSSLKGSLKCLLSTGGKGWRLEH